MDLRGLFPLAAALGLLAPSVRAQSTNSCRHFTALDGLAETACQSGAAGPTGDVLIRHPHTNTVSLFDGYKFSTLPGPPELNPVYQSPGAQLWTVARDGLREFRNGEWELIPLAPVAAHFRAGRTNEILLRPVRHGRLLVLMPGELLQVTAESVDDVRVESLLVAAEVSLGTFTNLATLRSGALCVFGTTGFARCRQNFRALLPGDEWEITPVIPDYFVADDSGGVVWRADDSGLTRCAPMIWQTVPDGGNPREAQSEIRNPQSAIFIGLQRR